MNASFRATLALLLVAAGTTCWAADKVKPLQGTQSTGKLTLISPTEIVLELGSKKTTFAVNEVDTVQFDTEPNDLTQARIAVRAGRYDDAVTALAKIDTSSIKRADITRDVDYYKALAAVRLALAGTGSKAEAGKKLLAFEKANTESFHYFEACEAIGDLLVALNRFDQAETYYNKLADAPWKDYQLRASVLAGRALVSQKQYQAAIDKFDTVLDTAGKATEGAAAKEAQRQKLAATMGKAAALMGLKKNAEAVKLAQQTINEADSDNLEAHARAYLILGNCYLAEGKKKDALLAFLHVDLLYARFPDLHAEALAHLSTLWAELDKTDRANQAKAQLKEKYPNSVWASK